jgi:hydrogenase maturation protein HypF
VDDSVARAGVLGPVILRRSRGYAPGAVTTIPSSFPILAVGADLKNAITLVVNGQAFVSQHVGDLSDYACLRAFEETVNDLCSMYEVNRDELVVAHDCHPEYVSTSFAKGIAAARHIPVQHHRAHVASVLAERGMWDQRAIGISCDGTGFGDDGTIWGGEFFLGSVREGFERIAHLRPVNLPGGDAAALHPVQAAAGFLSDIDDLPDLYSPPFMFPARYRDAQALAGKGIRSFQTTSMGRLFDTAAALLGFTRAMSFEGQAAMWLEQLARSSSASILSNEAYPFPFEHNQLDFRPLLHRVAADRAAGRPAPDVARAFQRGIARGLVSAIGALCDAHHVDTAVLSGGVFQNELLLTDLNEMFATNRLRLFSNQTVPPNDGGISLGQAALAAFAQLRGEGSKG